MTAGILAPVPAPAGTAPDVRRRLEAILPVIRDQAAIIDEDASFPQVSLTALRGSGLLGLLVPVRYDGLGGTLHDLVEVAVAMGGQCLSTAMIWAMHCQQVAALVKHATPGLCDRLLPRVGRGEVYVSSVTTERGKGGHLLTAHAPLRRAGGMLCIERDAPIVTGGLYADGFLITMRDTPSAPPNAVSLVYADRAEVRVDGTGTWNPLGMRGTHSVALTIQGQVSEDNLVGQPGGFRAVAVSTLAPVGHLAWAACWLGAARGGLRGLLHLLRSPEGRRQFDVRSELLRTRIARVRSDLDAVAALVSQCLRDLDGAEDLEAVPIQLRLNTLKVFAAERCFAAADTLIETAGLRHGYLRGAPLALERAFRDLRSASLNYANDRLLLANGALAMLDRDVSLAY